MIYILYQYLRKRLNRILSKLDRLEHKLKHMEDKMVSQEEFDASVVTLETKIADIGETLVDYGNDIKAAIKKLQDQIGSGGGGVNADASFAKLLAMTEKVSASGQTLKDLDLEAEGITGVPTPPPAPPVT